MTPWRLVPKHLLARPGRTILTTSAVVLALFLFVFLISLVTTLDAAINDASSNRLFVQSNVSLFVELPRDYQPKVAGVDGVKRVTKYSWFGGYYKEEDNLARFGVDWDQFFPMFRKDIEIIAGPDGTTGQEAWDAAMGQMAVDRRAAVVGAGIAAEHGWSVGDTVPLKGTIYQMADGSAWDFHLVGLYQPQKGNVDDQTMFFRNDYLHEMLDSGQAYGPRGVGSYFVEMEPGAGAATVSAAIDRLFENGPQVTRTVTEAALQASFVAMLGNLPLFVGTIGGAVVFAVLFATINTMLMAARQRTHELGILKALGFPDGALARLVLTESLTMSLVGGAVGLTLGWLAQEPTRAMLGAQFPTYSVSSMTLAKGAVLSLLIGLIAGVVPAWQAARLSPTEALRSDG